MESEHKDIDSELSRIENVSRKFKSQTDATIDGLQKRIEKLEKENATMKELIEKLSKERPKPPNKSSYAQRVKSDQTASINEGTINNLITTVEYIQKLLNKDGSLSSGLVKSLEALLMLTAAPNKLADVTSLTQSKIFPDGDRPKLMYSLHQTLSRIRQDTGNHNKYDS